MTSSATASRGLVRVGALVGAAWVILTCAFYYRQIWRVVAGGLGPWPILDGPRDLSLPFLSEAVRSGLTSILGAAILIAVATAVGLAIIARLRLDIHGAAERLPIAASLGVGVLAYVGLALTAIGAYRPFVLRVLIGVLLLVAGIGGIRRHRSGSASVLWRMPDVRGADLVWLVVSATALAFALYSALAPAVDYDALWYHLYFPRVYLDHGRLVDLAAEYPSLYPMTWDLWFGYGLAFGGPTTATLLHFATLPLAAMAVYALARRYALPASPWLAAAVFVTAPTVLWEGTTAYVDMAFTLHVAVTLFALLRYRETKRAVWLGVAAAELGLALATKHVGLITLAIFCGGLAIARWRDDRRVIPAIRVAAALGFASLLIPLPWYLRAWWLAGDPVFPELFTIFGAPVDRWDATARGGLQRFFAGFGRPRTLPNQLTLPWDMTMHAERYGGTLGPLFLALVPAAAFAVWRPPNGVASGGRPGLRALGIFVVAYLVLWASPIASFQVRWLLAAVPALAILAAVGYERVTALAGSVAVCRAVLAVVVGAMVLSLPPFVPLHEHERRSWDDYTGWLTHVIHAMPVVVVGAESRDAYVERHVPTYAAWQATRDKLPDRARVLTWAGGDHFYGPESRIWVFSPATRAAASAPKGDEHAAFERLRALSITHILIDKGFLRSNRYADSLTWESFALTNATTIATHYERMYEDDRAALYRIRWEAVAP